jgi:DUF4097 and DUF4098 domain-containing protein YvlB
MRRFIVWSVAIFLVCAVVTGELFARSDRVIEKEFKLGKGKKLELEIDSGGSLEIEGWDKKSVDVRVQIKGRDADDVEVEFDKKSSGLVIHSYFESRGDHKAYIDFEIRVPDKFDISIDSKGGRVSIAGVEGTFSGKTMGGSIELERLKGEVALTTMGGSIEVINSDLDGKVKTMGGSVVVEDVVGDLEGSTMGGDIEYRNVKRRSGKQEDEVSIHTMGGDIEVDRAGKRVHVKTYGGDIEVSRSEEVEAMTMGGDIEVAKSKKVNVKTMGGDIDVEEAREGAHLETMGGDITIGAAGEYVKAKTMGGDIEVRKIDGWVKATTMGGDVMVKMVGDPDKGRRDVEIKSMGGQIELEVPAGLDMTFDIELAYTKDAKRDYEIISDFDMEIEKTKKWERYGGTKKKYIYGTGTVGSGKHEIKIKTVNGNIYIRKGR